MTAVSKEGCREYMYFIHFSECTKQMSMTRKYHLKKKMRERMLCKKPKR